MVHTHGMGWTKELVGKVRRLAADRLTSREIAVAIGPHVTFSMVISAARRHGIKLYSQGGANLHRGKYRQAPPKTVTVKATAPVPLPTIPPPKPRRIALLDLEAGDCRFPLGDPGTKGFSFCGLSAAGTSSPYCAHHERICYMPAAARKFAHQRLATRRA